MTTRGFFRRWPGTIAAACVLVWLSGAATPAQQWVTETRDSKQTQDEDFAKAKQLADVPIHVAVDDMQIAEDMQLIVGHMIMQWLYQNPPAAKA